MTPVDITAYTATNAAGTGRAALHRALVERHSRLRPWRDPDCLETCIGELRDTDVEPVVARLADYDCRNHCLAQLAMRLGGFNTAAAAPGNVMAAVGTLSLPPRASARPSARIAARMRTAPCRLISATSRCRSLHAVPIVVQQLFGAHLDGVLDGATGGLDRPTPIADALSGVMLRV